jgi:hypothetical protein
MRKVGLVVYALCLLVMEQHVLSCGIPSPAAKWALPLNGPGSRWRVSNPWDSSFQVDLSHPEQEISLDTREWMPDFVWLIPENENMFNPPITSAGRDTESDPSPGLKVSLSISTQIIHGDPNTPPSIENVQFVLFNHSFFAPGRTGDAWPNDDPVASQALIWSQSLTKDIMPTSIDPTITVLNVEVPRIGQFWRSGKLSLRLRWSRPPYCDKWRITIQSTFFPLHLRYHTGSCAD